jgi:alpha-L-fucosidase
MSAFAIVLSTGWMMAQGTPQAYNGPTPTPAQLQWQQAEFGVLISYELHTFNEGRYIQRKDRVEVIKDVNQFNPTELNTDQWVRAAKAAGATFAILTASHESGFRLWQSDVNPYCLKAVKWGDGKRDILREFVDSCRTHGIRPGVYLGTRWNAQLGVFDFKVTQKSPITQEAYNRLIEQEVEEICTRYGPFMKFWFDGGAHGPDQGGPDVLSIVAKHQPEALFYHNLQRADARWGGSETGTVPYPCWATFPYQSTGSGETAKQGIAANRFALLKHGDPDGQYWMPAMSDAPLRGHGGHSWFWDPGEEPLIYPMDKLVDMYLKSVGHNSTLILGITPDTRGLMPDADVKRLGELGAEINRLFAHPLATARGKGDQVKLAFAESTAFDCVVIQEDIAVGERVREFGLEVLSDGQWVPLASGNCIGHKYILRLDKPVTGVAVRLRIKESIAEPQIHLLSVYNTSQDKPPRDGESPD